MSVFESVTPTTVAKVLGLQLDRSHRTICPVGDPTKRNNLALLDRGFACHLHGKKGGWVDLAKHLGWDAAAFAKELERASMGGLTPAGLCRAAGDTKSQKPLVKAEKIWKQSVAIDGTPAASYLKSRGIDPTSVSDDQIRFRKDADRPAMVARVTDSAGKLVAVQCTYLSNEGRKDGKNPPRKSLGRVSGSAVRFGALRASSPLVLTEGVEDALAISTLTDGAVWATLGTSGLKGLKLPDIGGMSELVIFADHDRAGLEAAEELAAKAVGHGHSVRLAKSPLEGEDPNDVLMRGGVNETQECLAQSVPRSRRSGNRLDGALAALSAAENTEAVRTALVSLNEALGNQDRLTRELTREKALLLLRKAGIQSPARVFDAAVQAPNEEAGEARKRTMAFDEIVPAADSQNGHNLLESVRAEITRYVAFPTEHAATVATLWVVYSHAFNMFSKAAYLQVASAEKGCGKTTLLTVLSKLAPKSLFTSNISPAALFRVIERYQPTLFIDEADTFLAINEELRGVLNGGHTREGAFVLRVEGDQHDPVRFSTWAPKVLAGIGSLPEATESRCHRITLLRRSHAQQIERLRGNPDEEARFSALRSRIVRWVNDAEEDLQEAAYRDWTGMLNRAGDLWDPLLAIAAIADWSERASKAAEAFAAENYEEERTALLLADIMTCFGVEERLASAELVQRLKDLPDRPWSSLGRNGTGITMPILANWLRNCGIPTNRTLRIAGKPCKGYERHRFDEAFRSFSPPESSPQADEPLTQRAPTPSQSVTRLQPNDVGGFPQTRSVTSATPVTEANHSKLNEDGSCNRVTGISGWSSQTPATEKDTEIDYGWNELEI